MECLTITIESTESNPDENRCFLKWQIKVEINATPFTRIAAARPYEFCGGGLHC